MEEVDAIIFASSSYFEANMVISIMKVKDGFRRIENDRKAIKPSRNLGERLIK